MTLNKVLKRGVAIVLSVALVGSVAGCKKTSQPADPSLATEVPDYSDSTARMNMYSYICPTPGNYTTAAGAQVYIGDQRSVQSFQEYKDCGFDTLMLLGNDAYRGQDWETSDLKRNLEMAEEVGLNVIVHDDRIHVLSTQKESLIGEGKEYSSLEELSAQIKEWMSPYIDHPVFYGMSLMDEPSHCNFQALSEVTKAIKMIDENIYVHTVLFPYLEGVTIEQFTGKSFGNVTIDSYKTYIGDYLDMSEADYVGYDNYPFMADGLLSSFYLNLQTAVAEADKRDADVVLSVQSSCWDTMRKVEEDDLRFQGYSAMALGAKNLVYYTYYMFPNQALANYRQAIKDNDGTNIIYDEVQRVNGELQELAKVLLHFDYEKATFTYDKENAISAPTLFSGLKNEELKGVEIVSVTQPTMITQMKDSEKDLTGYMVMNSSDPEDNLTNNVHVKFEGYDYATIYVKGVPETVGLTDSVLTLTLETGEGVFVIPHK